MLRLMRGGVERGYDQPQGVEVADLIIKGINGAIGAKTVTYDFERQMDGATLLKCSEFGEAIVSHM